MGDGEIRRNSEIWGSIYPGDADNFSLCRNVRFAGQNCVGARENSVLAGARISSATTGISRTLRSSEGGAKGSSGLFGCLAPSVRIAATGEIFRLWSFITKTPRASNSAWICGHFPTGRGIRSSRKQRNVRSSAPIAIRNTTIRIVRWPTKSQAAPTSPSNRIEPIPAARLEGSRASSKA